MKSSGPACHLSPDRLDSPVTQSDIRLLVRADDMASSWAANEGCLRACTKGIARSVEVMMPCAWVPDAAHKLAREPGIDVGIHLTLTSEWDASKWRPLTAAPSLTDENGYFLPLLTPRADDTRPSLAQRNWALEQIQTEFQAQIEYGLRLFPQASHISSHMTRHFRDFDDRLDGTIEWLCQKYNLRNDPLGSSVPMLAAYPKPDRTPRKRIEAFLKTIRELTPGTYMVVDHPTAHSEDETELGHDGYRDVAEDRRSCLSVFTSRELVAECDRLGIELIDYRAL